MKFIAILLISGLMCYAQLDFTPLCIGERLKSIEMKCMVETRASPVDISDMERQQHSRTENAKCFRACVLRECNMMDFSGHFFHRTSHDMAEAMTNGDANQLKLVKNIIQMCLQRMPYSGNKCQNAENIFMCTLNSCKTSSCNLDLQRAFATEPQHTPLIPKFITYGGQKYLIG